MAEFRVTRGEILAGLRLPTSERHLIRIVPDAVRLSLFGMYFDTSKNFILPAGLEKLKKVKPLYLKFPESKLLIVGHTDTAGSTDYNDVLSLERAEAMAAYLNDDVDAWLGRYQSSVAEDKRWGEREDFAMLRQLRNRDTLAGTPPTKGGGYSDLVRQFQNDNGLTVDGIAGPKTRRELIKQYMAEDDTTLPQTIKVTKHGCGEFFPVNTLGTDLHEDAADDQPDAKDRRVELFFFNGKDGIKPPVVGTNSKKGSTEYPKWRALADTAGEWSVGLSGIAAVRGASRFTRASTFPKPSLLPAAEKVLKLLRGDALLNVEIVGHCDPSGDADFNIDLSRGRATVVAAWLRHDAADFRKRFDSDDPFRKWDWEELQWMLLAVRPADRPLYLAKVDGVAGPETHGALSLFQALNGLPVHGLADDATLDALINAYLDLLGPGLEPDRVFAEGAGSDHPIISFGPNQDVVEGDGSAQRLRRVEFFVTEGRMSPPAFSLAESATSYEKWCAQVKVDGSLPFVFDTHITVVDDFFRPLKGEHIIVFENGDPDDIDDDVSGSVAEGNTDDAGMLTIQVPRGHYELVCQSKEQVLSAALSVDPDEHGAQRIRFLPEPEDPMTDELILASTPAERGEA